ncbi:hypothetical protein ACIF85_30040 [Streptomyces sp. NPDC086033]
MDGLDGEEALREVLGEEQFGAWSEAALCEVGDLWNDESGDQRRAGV